MSTPVLPSELMIRDGVAYHIGVAVGAIAPRLLLVGDPARATLVAERFDSVDHESRHREFVTYTGTLRGLDVSVMGTGIGTDNVEIALLEAVSLLAFDPQTCVPLDDPPAITALRIGTSAGIQSDIPAGTAAVSTYAVGLDSTGLYYEHVSADPTVAALEREATRLLRESTPEHYRFRDHIRPYASRACPEVADALHAAAVAHRVAVVRGTTIAAPGFYGASGRTFHGLKNTVPDIKHRFSALGHGTHRAVNMEMESSLLFHLADCLGIRAGTICPVISRPGAPTAVVDYAPHVADCITVALDALCALG